MGSYVNNNLVKDESVVHEAHLHWILYFNPKSILTLFLWGMIQQWTSEFAITNKRVIIKMGLISRRTLEMNLSKIESVNVNQSIAGRILGFGSITVIGTGGSAETFHNIAKPVLFRKQFQELSV